MKKLLIILLTFVSFTVFAGKQSLTEAPQGWDEMREEIKKTSFRSLDGMSFELVSPYKGIKLIILPKGAFTLTPLGEDRFKATVADKKKLFLVRGGIPTLIMKYDYEGGGSSIDNPDIHGNSQCLYNMSFTLSNGDPINFQRVKTAWDIAFNFNPKRLKFIGLTKETAKFKRIKNGSASVILKITNKKDGTLIESDAVLVPYCDKILNPTDSVMVSRTPGQCVTMSSGVTSINNRIVNLNGHTLWNTCDKKIMCQIVANYYYEKNGAKVTAKDEVIESKLPAHGFVSLKSSYDFNPLKLSKATKIGINFASVSDSTYNLLKLKPTGLLKCKWDDTK